MSIRCLITAGPTREFFDPVRFLSNPSSGKMGFALAAAAKAAGWTVDLVTGPVSLPEPAGVLVYPVVTAEEMLRQTDALFGPCDILIMAAAVSDWRPRVQAAQKVKKGATSMTVEFESTPDILAALSARRRPEQYLVGFAAETEAVEQHALEKLERKNLDLIVANSVFGPQSAFGSEQNRVVLLGRGGWRKVLGPAPKTEIAQSLIAHLDQVLKTSTRNS
jgi:phosphopantothenoylcysteine decarboxylase/phosphopantothenate--cysteine ligase